jgi:hypothetical protein
VYFGMAGPDPALTMTSSNGGVIFGNVGVGDFTISVMAGALTCAPTRYGWPSTKGAADGTTLANTNSFIVVHCK